MEHYMYLKNLDSGSTSIISICNNIELTMLNITNGFSFILYLNIDFYVHYDSLKRGNFE